ncbi:MAG: hypothetical protein WD357_08015 [Gracilimonas sp.]
MTNTIFKKFFLLLFILSPLTASAQMFSVGDERNRTSDAFSPYARAGIYLVDFKFTGDPAELTDGNSLSFNGSAAHIGYESGGLNFGLAFGSDFTQLDNRRFFSLNLDFTNPFYIVRKQNFGVGIPIKLRTKVTSVRSDEVQEEFSQTDLSAGGGLIMRINAPEKFNVTTQFIPSIGFSTSSGGFLGGRIVSLSGKARMNFYNLLFGKNISLGYDYIFDSYDIDGEQYDYDVNGHLITLGVSL